MVHLALLMMVKNEHLRIEVSLNSVLGVVDSIVVLDTGSTDNTVDIIVEWCKKHNMPLYLKEEPFTTFCKSRNVSLDFLDTTPADYAILLDCNDELQKPQGLRTFVNNYDGPCSAFHVCQIWWNGISNDKYYNIRLIKAKHGWRYKRNVHEYMTCEAVEEFNRQQIKRQRANLPTEYNKFIVRVENEQFILFQDRTLDDDKSFKRFSRDKTLLYADYKDSLELLKKYNTNEFLKNPGGSLRVSDSFLKTDDKYIDVRNDYARTLFYLAQTLTCLQEHREAYKYYRKRTHEEGFNEEVYHSYYRCGELGKILGHNSEDTIMWYLKSFYYSVITFNNPRVESLIKLADHYISESNWMMAYIYLEISENIPYPEDLILFVDRRMYDYTRYNLLERVCMYIGKNKQGLLNGLKAVQYLYNTNLSGARAELYKQDLQNLKWYITEDSLNKLTEYINATSNKQLDLSKFTTVNFEYDKPLTEFELQLLPDRKNITQTTSESNSNYLGKGIYNNYLTKNITTDIPTDKTKLIESINLLKKKIKIESTDTQDILKTSQGLEGNTELCKLYNYYIQYSKILYDEYVLNGLLNHNIEYTKIFMNFYIENLTLINHKALELSAKIFGHNSIAVYTNLANIFCDVKNYKIGMLYTKLAIESPINNIFDKEYFDYTRWHTLGRVAWYINNIELGRNACINALLHKFNDIDSGNLKYYIKNSVIRTGIINSCKNKDLKTIVKLLKDKNIDVNDEVVVEDKLTKIARLKEQLKAKIKR
jgi:hypothetical protein